MALTHEIEQLRMGLKDAHERIDRICKFIGLQECGGAGYNEDVINENEEDDEEK